MHATCPRCGDTHVKVFVRRGEALICKPCAAFSEAEDALILAGLL